MNENENQTGPMETVPAGAPSAPVKPETAPLDRPGSKPTAPKKGSKSAKKGKGKAKATAKKESAGRDKFNMRLGTRAARLNEAIGTSPRTPKEICELAQYTKPIYSHLAKLLHDGYVNVDKDGRYRQAAKKAKKAKKEETVTTPATEAVAQVS